MKPHEARQNGMLQSFLNTAIRENIIDGITWDIKTRHKLTSRRIEEYNGWEGAHLLFTLIYIACSPAGIDYDPGEITEQVKKDFPPYN